MSNDNTEVIQNFIDQTNKKEKQKFKFSFSYNDELMSFISRIKEDTNGAFKTTGLINKLIRNEPITIYNSEHLDQKVVETINKGSTVKRFSQNASQIKLHFLAANEFHGKSKDVDLDLKAMSLIEFNSFISELVSKKNFVSIFNRYNNQSFIDILLEKIKTCLSYYDTDVMKGLTLVPISSEEKNNYLRELNQIKKAGNFNKRTCCFVYDVEKLNEVKRISQFSRHRLSKNKRMATVYSQLDELVNGLDNINDEEKREVLNTLKLLKLGYEQNAINPSNPLEAYEPTEKTNTEIVIWLLENMTLQKQSIDKSNTTDIEEMNKLLSEINKIVRDCNLFCNENSNENEINKFRLRTIIKVCLQYKKLVEFLSKRIDNKHLN
ncbi:hypothetical protein J7943_13485 [Vibrio parahaemolyticus]|uniref:hypothetical protein n=1 Tax=Vibrio parahaemolyticus TaxID=670 RepID=UPI001D4208C0|nr:hypothetical protein [Vibrio parahaemolyticus]EJG1956016.1 hypothetical protein [Vibrio parahaemolyticus]MCF9522272.1 hypothetical protein [Vibrio parahaemolyticus]MCF9565415.1 hypothetical protein [Vibrio parahaemolyticus]MCF9597476.1 hypothetical protein [Vibrio parahaemolyticus]